MARVARSASSYKLNQDIQFTKQTSEQWDTDFVFVVLQIPYLFIY